MAYSRVYQQQPFWAPAPPQTPTRHETLGANDLNLLSTDLSDLQASLLSLQNELQDLRSGLAKGGANFASGANVAGSRVGVSQRAVGNSVRFTTRFSGDGGAATPVDLARQGAETGDVMTYNGTIWTPSSLVPGGISSQNVSSGSVGAPSIYFGGNATSGYYSPAANQMGVSISGVQAVLINSSGIQLKKNVTLGLDNTNQHILNTVTSTTVGATGAAEAMPANPLGYWQVTINGVNCKIPYFTA